jgi:hypothetical protein
MSGKSLVVQSSTKMPIEQIRWDMELGTMAALMVGTGLFECNTIEDAVAKMMIGRELGLTPIQSMMGVFIMKTKHGRKVAISSNVMASKVSKHPHYSYTIIEHTDKKCVISFCYDEKEIGVSEYTMANAARAKLIRENGPWETVPENMLFARALSNGVRRFTPDALWHDGDTLGAPPLYTPDELDETRTPTGEIIEGDFSEKEPQESTQEPEIATLSEDKDQSWQDATANWSDNDWYPNFYKPTYKLIRDQTKTKVKDSELQALIKHACGVESMKDFAGTRGDLRIHTFRLIEQLKNGKPITDPDGKEIKTEQKPGRVSTEGKRGVNHLGRVDAKKTSDETVMLTLYGADDDTGEIDLLPLCDHEISIGDVFEIFQIESGEISDKTSIIYESDFHAESVGIVELKWKRDKDNKFIVVSLSVV